MLVRILNPGKLQGNGEDGQRLLRAIREGKGPIEGVYSLTFLGTNTQLVSECNNRLLKYDLGCGGKKTLMMEIRNPSLWAVSFTPEVLLKDPGNSLQKGGITPFGYTGSEKKT
jgi:hypothetical protein